MAKINQNDVGAAAPMGTHPDDYHVFDSLFQTGNAEMVSDEISSSLEAELYKGISQEDIAALHMLAPPEIPSDLPPKQIAQLAEFLQYIHLRLRYLVGTVEQNKITGKTEDDPLKVTLDAHQWQNLLDLYGRLSLYLHSVTEPK